MFHKITERIRVRRKEKLNKNTKAGNKRKWEKHYLKKFGRSM